MKPWLGALLSLTIGLGCLGGAFYLVSEHVKVLVKGEKAEGTVVEVSRTGGKSYYPTVRFVDSAGVAREFRSSAGSSPPAYAVDEVVTVRYLPERPQEAVIGGFFSLWFKSLALAAVGLLLLSAGGGMLKDAARSNSEDRSS